MLATTCVQQSAVKVTHQAKLRLSSSQKANREAVAAARAGNCPAMAPAVAALVVVALAVAGAFNLVQWENLATTFQTSFVGCFAFGVAAVAISEVPPVQQDRTNGVEDDDEKDTLHDADGRMAPHIVDPAPDLKSLIAPDHGNDHRKERGLG